MSRSGICVAPLPSLFKSSKAPITFLWATGNIHEVFNTQRRVPFWGHFLEITQIHVRQLMWSQSIVLILFVVAIAPPPCGCCLVKLCSHVIIFLHYHFHWVGRSHTICDVSVGSTVREYFPVKFQQKTSIIRYFCSRSSRKVSASLGIDTDHGWVTLPSQTKTNQILSNYNKIETANGVPDDDYVLITWTRLNFLPLAIVSRHDKQEPPANCAHMMSLLCWTCFDFLC